MNLCTWTLRTPVVLAICVFMQGPASHAQTAASYSFSTNTDAVLDPMTGADPLLSAPGDDVASVITDIGFPFNFLGTNYSQFSVSENGLVRLGATVVTTSGTNSLISTTFNPKIMLWDDFCLGQSSGGGAVRTVLQGTPGSRIRVVEWFVRTFASGMCTSTNPDKRFQLWLYEGTNAVEFRYGTGSDLSSATLGISNATVIGGDYNVITSTTAHTAATSTTAAVANGLTTWPGSGRSYRWTPPPPSIAYTPLANACALGDRTLTASIGADASVPTSGIGLPRLFWRIGTSGAFTAVEGAHAAGSNYTFTFGAGAGPAAVVQYYIVAQDNGGQVRCFPSAGAGTLTASPPNAGTPPTTPSSYTVTALGGTVNVGSAQPAPFNSLTNALAYYVGACLTGPTTFLLTSTTYSTGTGETFPIIVPENANASATNTLTIKPAGTATITGSVASNAIIRLNGADFVTIDGSAGSTSNSVCPASAAARDLTISNTNTGATDSGVIWVNSPSSSNPALNVTVRNCIITGNAATTTRVALGAGGSTAIPNVAAANHTNLRFENNQISQAYYGIYVVGVSDASKQQGTVINQNNISSVGISGIHTRFINDLMITGNTVTGVALSNATSDAVGISAGFATENGVANDGVGVSNGVSNVTITHNTIGTVVNTGGGSAVGIGLGATTTGTSLIANNMVHGVAANSTSPDLSAGVLLGGGTVNVYHNTVSMQGTITGATTANQTSACLAVTAAAASGAVLDLRNNIFSNTQAGNTGATSLRLVAIALRYSSTAGNYANLTSNNNVLYAAGTGPGAYHIGLTGGITGTPRTTIDDWRTQTGRDGASQNLLPAFTSATDLRLNTSAGANAPLFAGGANVGVAVDIDCGARSATNPTIGAHEVELPCDLPTGTATVVNAGCATYGIQVNVTGTGDSPGSAVNILVDGGPVQAGATVGGGPYTFGPYTNGTSHTVTLVHLGEALCNVNLPQVSHNVSCPTSGCFTCVTYACVDNACVNTSPNSTANFAGTGSFGSIPDNTPAGLTFTIPVSGVNGTVNNIFLNLTGLSHTYVGDLRVTLTRPAGATHEVFTRILSTACTGGSGTFGDDSNLGGDYTFNDGAATTLWTGALGGTDTYVIPSGCYRTTSCSSGNVATNLLTTFGLPGVVDINGNWTVNISDNSGGDVGTIAGVSLDVCWTPPCVPPTATVTSINDDCGTGFTLPVNVTSLGNSATATIRYSVNGGTSIPVTGVGTGTTTIPTSGSFGPGDVVAVEVRSANNNCGNTVGTFSSNCPIAFACADGVQSVTGYCYGNTDPNTWTFTNDVAFETASVTFVSGCIDPNDAILVYDEPGGNQIGQISGVSSFSNVSFQSSGQTVHIVINSDGSNSCQDGGCAVPWTFEVQCTPGCVGPQASLEVDNAGCSTTLDVTIDHFGDASSGTIRYIVNPPGTPAEVPATTGTTSIGPFTPGSTVQVFVIHGDDESCNLNLGAYVIPTPLTSCDDGDPLTTDSCVDNMCVHAPTPCDDGNACTINDVLVPGGVVQNFDGVTVPALPSGWTTSGSGTGSPWATVTTSSSTAPNAAFTNNVSSVSDRSLFSPSLFVAASGAQMTFKHRFTTESGWDGGVLEISINGGAFADIVTAGGSFVTGSYTGTIGGVANPIAGRQAWTGINTGSPAFITTTVNLPAAAVGNSVVFRWRFASDGSTGGTGWWVDDYSTNFGGTACQGTSIVPQGTASVVNTGCATYMIAVNVSSLGGNISVGIRIDGDPVGTGSAMGGYGPYGPFANGSSHTVELVGAEYPSCGFTLPAVSSPTVSCDDGDPTTADSCIDNVCVHAPIACDDGNPCTANDVLVLVWNGQNFDGVTAPALPAGWTSSVISGSGAAFTTVGTATDTPPNAAYTNEVTSPSLRDLVSPVLGPITAGSQLTFRHRWNSEASADGGVLEISINGGAFADIIAAGGSFVAGAYTHTLGTGSSNPLPGRAAWSGTSGGAFVTTTVNLPPAAAGNTVRFRWRKGNDSGTVASTPNGWWIDSITLSPSTICQGTFTGPQGTASVVNTGCATYRIAVTVTGTGSGSNVNILIDGAPVETGATVGGPYGPYGPFANGSSHTVELVDPGSPACGLTLPPVSSPTVSCDDGDPTTTDSCVDNVCVHAPTTCDDGNPCTINDVLVHAGVVQNFDGVTVPAIPTGAGWSTVQVSGTANLWVTATDFSTSAPNSAKVLDINSNSVSALVSPVINIGTGAQLTFRNKHILESGFDGGVLEIKIGAGAFTDIVTAGGSFVTGGYNATISSSFGSAIGGRQAWTGTNAGSPASMTTTVNLPASAAGQPVQLRWLMACDNSSGSTAWWIDDIALPSVICQGTFVGPQGTASVVNTGCATYMIAVNVSSLGSNTSAGIRIDGGLVESGFNVGGPYGPYGPFANGSSHTVELVGAENPSCGFTLPAVSSPTVSCDDGNPTTTDSCVDNVCVHAPTPCDDGNPCTINDVLVLLWGGQNFDGVTAPALPAGWTNPVISGSGAAFVTVTTAADTPPNAAYTNEVSSVSLRDLVSPVIGPIAAGSQLTFRHRWNSEASSSDPTVGFDGGVLEISINGGAFTDIIAAGGSFVTGGYTRTLSTGSSNPLPGRQAWSGTSGGVFVTTTVDLPPATVGNTVQFRWRKGNDASLTASTPNGWWIDSITLSPSIICQGTFQDTDSDGICDASDPCPLLANMQPGDACDDGDAGTENDLVTGACICTGTPMVSCPTPNGELKITSDGANTLTWAIYTVGGVDPVHTNTVPATVNGAEFTFCLSDGEYYLVVESSGSGIGGGYVLSVGGKRVVDNTNNFLSGSSSTISNNRYFKIFEGQLAGNDRLITASSDRLDLRRGVNGSCSDKITADNSPNGTSGNVYQYWFYDPNGGVGAVSQVYPSASTATGNILNVASLGFLAEGTLYNVRVRTRVSSSPLVWREWGPAVRLKIDNGLGQCPRTQLQDETGTHLSCGTSNKPLGSGQASLIYAKPKSRFTPTCGNENATKYQFRFRNEAETVVVVKDGVGANPWTYLNMTANVVGTPLGALQACGQYLVDVRVSFNGGSTWCVGGDPYEDLTPWGELCGLTIKCPVPVNGGGQNLALEGGGIAAAEGQLHLYPNPNNGEQLYLSLSAVPEGVRTVSVDIHDSFGKRVSTRTLAVNDAGLINTVLDLNGRFAAGMYVVSITAGEKIYTERLVVQP